MSDRERIDKLATTGWKTGTVERVMGKSIVVIHGTTSKNSFAYFVVECLAGKTVTYRETCEGMAVEFQDPAFGDRQNRAAIKMYAGASATGTTEPGLLGNIGDA